MKQWLLPSAVIILANACVALASAKSSQGQGAAAESPNVQIVISAILVELTDTEKILLGQSGKDRTEQNSGGNGFSVILSSDTCSALIEKLRSQKRSETVRIRRFITPLDQAAIDVLIGDAVTVYESHFGFLNDHAGFTLHLTRGMNVQGDFVIETATDAKAAALPRFQVSSELFETILDLNSLAMTVKIESGKTAVLGGPVYVQDITVEHKVDWLSELPVLGGAFRRETHKEQRKQLLLFLTPRLVTSAVNQNGGHPRGHLMSLTIAQLGQPILRQIAAEVSPEELHSPAFQQLVDDMLATLESEEGAGLAAPQVFQSKRVFLGAVLPSSDPDPEAPPGVEVFINPRIVAGTTETAVGWEGCLSFPELLVQVSRRLAVRIEYLSRHGEPKIMEAFELPARIIQHECDHLDGILTLDKAVSSRHIIKASEIDVIKKATDPESAP